MNRTRRRQLQAQRDLLSNLDGELAQLKERAEGIKSAIETLRDEEQDYLDNMPGSMQTGEKGSAAEAAVAAFDRVIDALEELDSLDLRDALEALDEARA